eukprot:m.261250 g.261250  ORF g.261250 m.261250 type:complete len:724 (+) comp16217_c0_seq3:2230-4401(+)
MGLTVGSKAVARFPYTPEQDLVNGKRFLAFEAGDIFDLLENSHPDWWKVFRVRDQAEGFVPTGFLTAHEESVQASTEPTLLALWSYEATAEGELTFQEDDRFFLCKKNDDGWWNVRTISGKEGLAPANYLREVEKTNTKKWFHGSISREEADKRLQGGPEGTFLIRESLARRGAFSLSVKVRNRIRHTKVEFNDGLYAIPSLGPCKEANLGDVLDYYNHNMPQAGWSLLLHPCETESEESMSNPIKKESIGKRNQPKSRNLHASRPAPPPPDTKKVTQANLEPPPKSNAPPPNDSSQTNSENSGTNNDEAIINDTLIQFVRDKTGLSFEKSRMAVMAVMGHLLDHTEGGLGEQIMAAVGKPSEQGLDGGMDNERLNIIFEELTAMKNDGQERSWAVSDETDVIQEYLEELLDLVKNADPRAVFKNLRDFNSVGQTGSFEFLETLVTYFQMEANKHIRMLLIQLFKALAELRRNISEMLQNSNLPLELIRDISVDCDDPTNEHKTYISLQLCNMMFTCGKALPAGHFDYLDSQFVKFLLHLIERKQTTPLRSKISTEAISLLLAFHRLCELTASSENMFLSNYQEVVCQELGQKLVDFLNYSQDPLTIHTGVQHSPSSPMMMLLDIFSLQETANSFLFTSDYNVLVDVIIRELRDRDPVDRECGNFIFLLENMIKFKRMEQDYHSFYRDTDIKVSVKLFVLSTQWQYKGLLANFSGTGTVYKPG